MPHTRHAGAAPSTGAGMLRPIDQSSLPDDEARGPASASQFSTRSGDAANFQALASKISMVGADTVISLSGQTIVLVGVSSSSLTAQDFAFD